MTGCEIRDLGDTIKPSPIILKRGVPNAPRNAPAGTAATINSERAMVNEHDEIGAQHGNKT